MVSVQQEGIILDKTNREFEIHGLKNPAIIQQREGFHLFCRAVVRGCLPILSYCRIMSHRLASDRWQRPLMAAEQAFESNGLEDPRLVKIDNQYLTVLPLP